jgi:GNAT superfamily N-acetyltransferase
MMNAQNEANQDVVRIEHLAGHEDAIRTVAGWIREEWEHSFLDSTFEELLAELEGRTTPGRIPETFVALAGDRLVGTASIVTQDMSTRPEISPCLSAVYVPPEFRKQGIGSKLVRKAMQEAQDLGVRRLYLFTPDAMSFYRRLGWNEFERMRYRGRDIVIMFYEVVLHKEVEVQ